MRHKQCGTNMHGLVSDDEGPNPDAVQVRALETEMLLRINEAGLDIEPGVCCGQTKHSLKGLNGTMPSVCVSVLFCFVASLPGISVS